MRVLRNLQGSLTWLIDFTRALVGIDYLHHEIHDGGAFSLISTITIPASSAIFLQMITGTKEVHIRDYLTNSSANNVLFTVYEAPTITNGTTASTPINRRRSSANTPLSVFYSNPTSVSGGTVVKSMFVPGGKEFKGIITTDVELIFKPSTSYALRLENLAAGNINVYYENIFYEE